MRLDKIEFVYIDFDYLKYLHRIDPEVQCNEVDAGYEHKPHVGILIGQHNFEYVIPLTSAKPKHAAWKDATASWYRVYEIVDIRAAHIGKNDIMTDIRNQDILMTIPADVRQYYKQRILSILDMRKTIPVKKGVYTKVEFKVNPRNSTEENKRIFLMLKEYEFLNRISDKIAEKTSKIYDKQIQGNKVLPFHCNFKLLEAACVEYNQ